MPLSPFHPPRTPVFNTVTSGQHTIPAGAGPFQIIAVSGNITVNAATFPYPWLFASDICTLIPVTVGTTGGIAGVSYMV